MEEIKLKKNHLRCQVCEKTAVDIGIKSLKWCIKCRCGCYCSKECQQYDWPQHRKYVCNNRSTKPWLSENLDAYIDIQKKILSVNLDICDFSIVSATFEEDLEKMKCCINTGAHFATMGIAGGNKDYMDDVQSIIGNLSRGDVKKLGQCFNDNGDIVDEKELGRLAGVYFTNNGGYIRAPIEKMLKNNNTQFLIQVAVKRGNVSVVKLLVDAGIYINMFEYCLLKHALGSGKEIFPMVKYLVDAGCMLDDYAKVARDKGYNRSADYIEKMAFNIQLQFMKFPKGERQLREISWRSLTALWLRSSFDSPTGNYNNYKPHPQLMNKLISKINSSEKFDRLEEAQNIYKNCQARHEAWWKKLWDA